MKKYLSLMLLLLSGFTQMANAQRSVQVMTFAQLEKTLKTNKDTLLVVNFWATWCKPCVQELPHFEYVNREMQNQKVKVILVSNDFVNEFDTRLKPFVRAKYLQSQVIALNETDPNEWIDKVSPKWGGALPATLLVNDKGEYVAFHDAPFTQEELVHFIEPHLPKK